MWGQARGRGFANGGARNGPLLAFLEPYASRGCWWCFADGVPLTLFFMIFMGAPRRIHVVIAGILTYFPDACTLTNLFP